MAGHVLGGLTASGSGTNVGNYPVTFTGDVVIMDGEVDVTQNYAVTLVEGNLQITPAQIAVTVQANSDTKVYTGLEQTVSGYQEPVGLLAGHVLSGLTASGSGTNVGNYPVTFSGTPVIMDGEVDVTQNYAVTLTPGNLQITPAQIAVTVQANSGTKVYTGSEQTVSGYQEPVGLLAGHVLSGLTASGSGTNVGNYPVTFTGDVVIMDGEVDVTQNYDVTFVDGSLEITAAELELTVTAKSGTFTYNGTDKTVEGYTVTGLLDGHELSGVSASRTEKNVGTYPVEVIGTAVIMDGGVDVTQNYAITLVPGNLEITEATGAELSVSDYEGEYDSAFHSIMVGVLEEEGNTVLYSEDEATWSETKPEYMDVGEYTVYVRVTNPNYAERTGSGTVKITERPLEITAGSSSKVYDGNPLINNTYTNGVLAGTDNVESVTVTGSRTEVGKTPNVASDAVIKRGDEVVTGNYNITYVAGELEVTPAVGAQLSVSGYEGEYDSAFHSIMVGVLEEEGNTVLYSEDEATWSETKPEYMDVGEYTVYVRVTNPNYAERTGSGIVKITQRPISITAASDSKEYDGTALMNDGWDRTVGDLADGEAIDSVTVTGSQTDPGSSDNVPKDAVIKRGEEVVTGNYDITYKNGTLTVKKNSQTITITAVDDSKIYDGTALTNDDFSYTTGILASGDLLTAVVEGTITDVGSVDNVVKSYQVMRGGTDVTSFYTFDTANGTLTVNKKALTITAKSDEKEYDGTALTRNEYEHSGVADGDSLTGVTVTGSQTDVGSSPNVPSAAVIRRGDKDAAGNYDIEYVNGILKVTKKSQAITITAVDDSKIYDGTALTNDDFSYTTGILASGDILSAVVDGTITNVGSATNVVTSYKVMRGTEDVTSFYTFGQSADGTLTVTQRPIEVTANAQSKVYGEDDPALTYKTTSGSLVGSDAFTGALTREPGNDVGDYDILQGTLALTSNYALTYVGADLTITPKTASVTPNDKSKAYGEDDPVLDGVLDGFLPGDNVTATYSRTDGEAVGFYTISATLSPTDALANYNVTYNTGTLTITSAAGAQLSITGYDGVYDGAFHSITVGDLEEEGNTVWYSEDAEDDEAWSPVKPEYMDVGNYTVYVKVTNPNYEDRLGSGTVTITERPLEITAGSATKTYDGRPLTKGAYTITGGSLADGDELVRVTVTGSRTDVGSTPNVASDAVIKRIEALEEGEEGGVDVTHNYDIAYVAGILQVSSRPQPPEEIIDPEVPPLLNLADHFAYIVGYPDNTVRPQGRITREEVAAVFFRLLDTDYRELVRASESNFPDVLAERWSSKHIATLATGRILEGYPDGTFKPGNFITRAELATVASRFDKLSALDTNVFPDVEGHWAEKYINSAAAKGWVEGYPDGTFKPDEYITRAEFVTLVNRVLQRSVQMDDILPEARQFPDLLPESWYYEAMQEAINSHLYERREDDSEEWLEINYPEIEM